MDSKNQDPAMDTKNHDPANGEVNDSELAGVTGGTVVQQLAHDAAVAAVRGAAEAGARHDRAGGFGPLIGGKA
jgi:hypothetical protein